MNAQVIVDLPEDVLQIGTRLAQLTSRKLSGRLGRCARLITACAWATGDENAEPLTKLSDKAILALAQLEDESRRQQAKRSALRAAGWPIYRK